LWRCKKVGDLQKDFFHDASYALRDDQWERLKDLLPRRDGYVGMTAKDNRLFVEAVLYRYRAGIPVARPARELWEFSYRSHSLQSVVKNESVGTYVSTSS
jgi:transposase